jgi:hypothetical protein
MCHPVWAAPAPAPALELPDDVYQGVWQVNTDLGSDVCLNVYQGVWQVNTDLGSDVRLATPAD